MSLHTTGGLALQPKWIQIHELLKSDLAAEYSTLWLRFKEGYDFFSPITNKWSTLFYHKWRAEWFLWRYLSPCVANLRLICPLLSFQVNWSQGSRASPLCLFCSSCWLGAHSLAWKRLELHLKTISASYNYIITKRAKIAGVLVSPSAICNLIEIRETSAPSNPARRKHVGPTVRNALQTGQIKWKSCVWLSSIHNINN